MDKRNLMPQAAQPVNRITTGQLPAELAELSEEVLQLHGDLISASQVEEEYCMAETCNVTCGCDHGYRGRSCDCVW